MKAFNRLRYPRTPEGRKKYIKDGLNPTKGKFIFVLLIGAGLSGMLALFLWLILDTYLSEAHFNLIILLTIISMLAVLCGLKGFRQLKERREP